MDLVKSLDRSRIQTLQDNMTSLENNQDEIITTWTSIVEVNEILLKRELDIYVFQKDYATPILTYFVEIIKGNHEIGNYPAIVRILSYLQNKDVTSSELFVLCVNLKNSIIQIFFTENKMTQELHDSISYVFDTNFRGILELFNDSDLEADDDEASKLYELYELSIRDHLTGVYNRQMFDAIFSIEMKKRKRHVTEFSLVLFDIDNFKTINENYGHTSGDQTLINLPHLVQGMLRDSDVLARWGGEEFIILLPKSNKMNSFIKAEQIRKAIEEYSFESIGAITCSFGVVEYEEKDTENSMLKRADEALYCSKAEGKNRVTSF